MKRVLLVLWALTGAVPLVAQIDVSGSVDVAFKHQLDKDPGQAATRINTLY
jgi:hypothetical protein